jgi:hypothetical protein
MPRRNERINSKYVFPSQIVRWAASLPCKVTQNTSAHCAGQQRKLRYFLRYVLLCQRIQGIRIVAQHVRGARK